MPAAIPFSRHPAITILFMCNLYSLSKGQRAIVELARAMRDTVGNLPPLPGIFPDAVAPIVRTAKDGVRELTMARWGFPPPDNLGKAPVTNVRNTASPYWRTWLNGFRCLVPATSFCEWTDTPPKVTNWFALSEERPLFCFAGIWRPWKGTRGTKAAPVEGRHLLYSILTCEPNATVRRVHAKNMPVILTKDDEIETWLSAPAVEALKLQRPPPDNVLRIVATGLKEDGPV